jgi:prepilin-type N-terminal cleavage/methylation domain-containing protein
MRNGRGFSLIELTVALALATLLLGLVVVRLNFGSERQQAINAARRLGGLIETYREKAAAGDGCYALQFDSERNLCSVFQPVERDAALLTSLQPLKSFELKPPLILSRVALLNRELPKPAVIFLDDKGLLPDLSIEISNGKGTVVRLRPDPLINTVRYEEP